MRHRHLNDSAYTPAAIDDVIARGTMTDWLALRDAARRDADLLARIARICAPYLADPANQRHYFWSHYAKAKLA
jgi:hypothetical protein